MSRFGVQYLFCKTLTLIYHNIDIILHHIDILQYIDISRYIDMKG